MFTSFQKRVLSFTLTTLALFLLGATFIYLLQILSKITDTLGYVLWPIAISGVLCLLLNPLIEIFTSYLKLSRNLSIILVYTLATSLLILFCTLLAPEIFNQVFILLDNLPDIFKKSHQFALKHIPRLHDFMIEYIGNENMDTFILTLTQNTKSILMSIFNYIKNTDTGISKLTQIIPALAVIPIYLFYFLQENRNFAKDIKNEFIFLKKDTREDLEFLAEEFGRIITSFFRGQMLISLIMGILLCILFFIIGLKFSLVLGLSVGLLNIIPFLGTLAGFLIVLPISYFQPTGGLSTLLFTFLALIAVQAFESNVLSPKIMQKQTGLHPAVVIFSIFFWGTLLNSILGLILAIPLTAFFVVFWRLLKEKHINIEPTIVSK